MWFILLRDQLDLTSPTGRVMFTVIAAMAEFERELAKERVQAGLRRARAQGKRLGQPPGIFHRDHVAALHQAKKSMPAIADGLGVSRRTVQRLLDAGKRLFQTFAHSLPHPPPSSRQCLRRDGNQSEAGRELLFLGMLSASARRASSNFMRT